MCGRISQWDVNKIEREYKPWRKEIPGQQKIFNPRYNLAPSQQALVKTKEGLELMRWGLVPSWSKTFSTTFSTINAKAETIETSKLYGRLLKSHRCLIPINAFYEWQVVDSKHKQPYLIKLKKRDNFALAGLYSSWYDEKDKEHRSFTIITTRPNAFMAKIHDRMPRILEKDQEKPWLEEEDVNYKMFFADQFPSSQMESYVVSTLVNSPKNNSETIITKVE